MCFSCSGSILVEFLNTGKFSPNFLLQVFRLPPFLRERGETTEEPYVLNLADFQNKQKLNQI